MPGIGVLGPVVVVDDDGTARPLPSRRQQLLLAVLTARRGQVVTGDELVEALWGSPGEQIPARPAAALQSQVHRLRKQLGAVLLTEAAGYRLAAAPENVDAGRFERLLSRARGRRREPAVALADLEAALGLWRGRAYLDLADNDAVRADATRLEDLRTAAAEERAALLLGTGRADEAQRAAQQLAAEHPYRERPVALHLRALAAAGRHVEALRAYDAFRRRLADDLGMDTSPELRRLESDLLRHTLPPPPAVGLPGNSFVGRERDLAAAGALAERARLVTFTGAGGVGKTRLVLHLAAAVAHRFPDGVYLCELAAVGDGRAVAAAVAATLRVEERSGGDLTARVVDYVHTKRALLVLDNCEHVVGPVADLVATVLARAPDVVVLATSRRRLGVPGEHVYPVPPLPLSGPVGRPSAAVELFVDRATAVRPDVHLGDDDLTLVSELCHRLEGLPLAIELAAARAASHPLGRILADIGQQQHRLGDAARRDDRHRSLEAAVAWSYQLLTSVQAAVFRQVSVFAGGWTADAVTAVAECGATEADDALTALVEHSLVAVETDGEEARYGVLEPIRQFARARLSEEGELGGAQARHAAWAAGWIEGADAGLRGADEARWRARVDRELANLRAAFRWGAEHEPALALRIVAGLYWYAAWHGPSEVLAWSQEAVARFGASELPHRAGALATAALAAGRGGELARARAWAERGIELAWAAEPPESAAARFAWDARRHAEVLAGHYEQALVCRDHGLALARVAGDRVHEAHFRAVGALALGYLGEVERAGDELAAARELLATADNPTVRALCEYVSGEMLVERAPAEAQAFLLRAQATAHEAGNCFVAGIAGASWASCAARIGDTRGAFTAYADVVELFHRAGAWTQLWTVVRSLVETLTRIGRDEAAAVLFGALGATTAGAPIIGADASRLADEAEALRGRLGQERFATLTAEGAELHGERVVAYALAVLAAGP